MTTLKTAIKATTLAIVFGTAATDSLAADVSQDAIDACIDAVRAEVSGGGTVTYTEFSEANSMVLLKDNVGGEWRCIVSNDGRMASVERAASSSSPADAARAATPDSGGPEFWQVSASGTLNVRSSPSASAQIVARLPSGTIVENRGCVDSGGRTWCEVADGDASGWAAIDFLIPSQGDGAASAPAGEPGTGTEVVRFASGSTGAQMTGSLTPGSSMRYIVGANARQDMTVEFLNTDPAIEYQIFNPDGTFLLEQINNTKTYRGELWQRGDHVVEVINRSDQTARYGVYIGVQ